MVQIKPEKSAGSGNLSIRGMDLLGNKMQTDLGSLDWELVDT